MRRTVILFTVFLLAIGWFGWKFPDLLSCLLLAALAAFVLRPLTDRLARRFHRKPAALLTLCIMMLLMVAAVFLILPALKDAFVAWRAHFGELYDALIDRFAFAKDWIPEQIPSSIKESLTGIALQTVSGVFASAVRFGLFIAAVYYLLAAKRSDAELLLGLFPAVIQETIDGILSEITRMLRSYLKSRVRMAVFMSAVSGIGLFLLDVAYAPVYAVLLFVLDFVPYFGTMIAIGLPVFAVLAEHGLLRGGLTLLFLILVQQVEESLLGPGLQSDAVGVHPFFGILALIIGGRLLGAAGVVLSLPVAGVIQILLSHLVFENRDSTKIQWKENREKQNGISDS